MSKMRALPGKPPARPNLMEQDGAWPGSEVLDMVFLTTFGASVGNRRVVHEAGVTLSSGHGVLVIDDRGAVPRGGFLRTFHEYLPFCSAISSLLAVSRY
jgi:hypothetical protein